MIEAGQRQTVFQWFATLALVAAGCSSAPAAPGATVAAGAVDVAADASTADEPAPPADTAVPDAAADVPAAPDIAAPADTPAADVPAPADAVAPPDVAAIPAAGCGKAWPVGSTSVTLANRSYRVHVPKGYTGTQALMVVVGFHGLGDSGQKLETLSGLSTAADTQGFLAVYPDGISGSWNAGKCCDPAKTLKVDDAAFVNAVLDDVQAKYCVDSKRIFATGFSNGGYMSQVVGCQLSQRFAAIAPVSGTMTLSTCSPTRPVSVLEFHGTLDFVVPYGGGGLTGGAASVDDTIAGWVKRNGCTDAKPAVVFQKGDTTCSAYQQCQDGAAVELCKIDGGGHQWPSSPTGGNPIRGKMSTDIDATAQILAFFAAHPMP